MIGLGTDIVQIERIEKVYQKQGERFLKRLLTEKEREVFDARKQSMAFLANRYAAKEAIAKALGTGIAKGVNFNDLEILPNEFGAPIVTLYGYALALFKEKGGQQVSISLSDEKDYAVAFVVLN
ncbi:holo-ACP synthase [Reinekea marina]|uniref:Holo-[acyl-carrier-protein] synthase n=1 Tax=Reinekea marina TaxID=1310421 RepID=A0ABV7WXB7_9GAMM|nr:holo-ACP synthase [Reinekea marina]MDN3650120.1 holo-ACP synthase [Reinekea marina]